MLSWLHISSNLDTAFSFTFFQHIFDLSKDNIKQKKKIRVKIGDITFGHNLLQHLKHRHIKTKEENPRF